MNDDELTHGLLWKIYEGQTRLYDALLVMIKLLGEDEHEQLVSMHSQGRSYYPPGPYDTPDENQDDSN